MIKSLATSWLWLVLAEHLPVHWYDWWTWNKACNTFVKICPWPFTKLAGVKLFGCSQPTWLYAKWISLPYCPIDSMGNKLINSRGSLNHIMQRLHCELPDAVIRQIPDCGHLPHVEKPNSVAKLILDFVGEDSNKEAQSVSQVWIQSQLVLNFGRDLCFHQTFKAIWSRESKNIEEVRGIVFKFRCLQSTHSRNKKT